MLHVFPSRTTLTVPVSPILIPNRACLRLRRPQTGKCVSYLYELQNLCLRRAIGSRADDCTPTRRMV